MSMGFLGLWLLFRSVLASSESLLLILMPACPGAGRQWEFGFNDTLRVLSGAGSLQEDKNQPSEYLSPDEGPVAVCPI